MSTIGPDPQSGQVGVVSPDGRWQWDGARWVPHGPMGPGRGGMSRGLATGLIAGAITVVLVVAATGFALFAGVSHGKYATIAHPCSLVDASAVSAIVPHAQTDEHGGPSAECKIAADGVATKLDAGLPV